MRKGNGSLSADNADVKLKRGIHPGIPMATYLADPCEGPSLSSGLANTILTRSPRHAYEAHPRLGGRRGTDSDAADTGTVAHDLLFGGEGKIAVIDADDWRTKAAKEARDVARACGLTPILAGKIDAVREMVDVASEYIERSEIADAYDDGGIAEVTMIWDDDGAWFRARPDWMSAGLIVHYKTTKGSAEPSAWIRNNLVPCGYDLAAGFYEWGAFCLGRQPQSVFLVQEQTAPYGCSLVGLSPAMMEIARHKVDRAVRLWTECIKTNQWPAYTHRVCYADPMPWQLAEDERKENETEEGNE